MAHILKDKKLNSTFVKMCYTEPLEVPYMTTIDEQICIYAALKIQIPVLNA